MALALRTGDAVYSHADFDKGRVARRSGRAASHARVDLLLSRIFGAKRAKAHLYRRLGERELEWKTEVKSESANQGFFYRIKRVAIQGCETETDRGYYFWMTTSTRRYNPNGSFYYMGNDDQRLVGVVMNDRVVHRQDLRFIVPADAPPPRGFEALWADPHPYEPGD